MVINDFIYLEIDKRCNGKCNCTEKIGDFDAKREDVISDVIGFNKYSHKLKDEQTFTLNRRLGKNEQLENEVQHVKSVAVYYWDGDPGYTKPLLLEVKTGSNTQYYYRYEEGESEALGNATIWKYVQGDHKLQDRLDDRNCGRNGAVPLNLQNLTSDKCFISSSCLKKERNIAESIYQSPKGPPGGEYTVKEYTINGGAKISRVTHGKQNVDGIDLTKNGISKVRVYSQGNVGSTNPPLMLQFIPKGGTEESKWFYSTNRDGNNWESVDEEKSEAFYDTGHQPQEALTTGLDDVRCFRDSEVTINLTKSISEGDQPYCCHYHGTSGMVSVTPVTVSCTNPSHRTSHLTAYKHSISGDSLKLAGIKFYLNGDNAGNTPRTRIILNTQRFPISSPVSIYAFYCTGNDPLLIYVDSSQANVKGWYKKGDYGGQSWIKLNTELGDTTPDNFSTLNCGQWKALREVLTGFGCADLKECPPDNSSIWVKLFGGGGASAVGTGGAAYGGWYAWVNYFLDPLVRLI
ncbi:hypothetical protein BEWA_048060 [Theileria equi strain WA]|uniref:Uncharacterized protein n=1 Tax=Theileria equi strain WA TaxID=1537102 RepID=L1LAR3_THEEQ|nr:hypothetical protein BEWA_048060 [Theileria equi strain WA]EKX72339.1 hypothetical protein BEWA_048060 [Theileria equi strain WA]|eukprot:XP_004831791.1 hypothetical protein BEWA_048060 [Theileria equi strain WA]